MSPNKLISLVFTNQSLVIDRAVWPMTPQAIYQRDKSLDKAQPVGLRLGFVVGSTFNVILAAFIPRSTIIDS